LTKNLITKFMEGISTPLSVVKFCILIVVGLFSNFQIFLDFFDLCLEILERKLEVSRFLLLSFPNKSG